MTLFDYDYIIIPVCATDMHWKIAHYLIDSNVVTFHANTNFKPLSNCGSGSSFYLQQSVTLKFGKLHTYIKNIFFNCTKFIHNPSPPFQCCYISLKNQQCCHARQLLLPLKLLPRHTTFRKGGGGYVMCSK